jgi:RNA polymerase sigma factor (sigma-70 family)
MGGLEKRRECEMIELASAGNPEGKRALWLHLYTELAPLIKRVASARGVARQDEEDAVHEVVCRIMDKIEGLRAPESFRIYAFRVMQNVARMFRPERKFEPFDEHLVPGTSEDRDLKLDVARVLAGLPPHMADAVVLVYLKGHSHREASLILRCSTRSLKRTLQNARARMRLSLKISVRPNARSKASPGVKNSFPMAA